MSVCLHNMIKPRWCTYVVTCTLYTEPFRQPSIFAPVISSAAIAGTGVIQRYSRRTSAPNLSLPPSQFVSLNWRGSYKTLTASSWGQVASQQKIPTAQLPLLSSPLHTTPQNSKATKLFFFFAYLAWTDREVFHPSPSISFRKPSSTTPTPKGRGGISLLASVQADSTPMDLWVRAGNKSHQKTALQGPHLSTKHDGSRAPSWRQPAIKGLLLSPKKSSARSASVSKARRRCVRREASQSQMALLPGPWDPPRGV